MKLSNVQLNKAKNVPSDRREHYLVGWLSVTDRQDMCAWHREHLQPHPRWLLDGLWNFRDTLLPKIMGSLSDGVYPNYEERMKERVKALLLDAASRLNSAYTHKPYRKTVQKYKLVKRPVNYPRTTIVYRAEELIARGFFGKGVGFLFPASIADILTAAAWGIFSPEAERFIAYRLVQMAESIEIDVLLTGEEK